MRHAADGVASPSRKARPPTSGTACATRATSSSSALAPRASWTLARRCGACRWRLALPQTAAAIALPRRAAGRTGRRSALVVQARAGRWRAFPESSSASSVRPAQPDFGRRPPPARARTPSHANQTRCRKPGQHRRRRGLGDPAQVRALRLLHRDLPDLPAARRRARRPVWPQRPHEAVAPGRRARPQDAAAPGPLPDLPRLRDRRPVGCAERRARGDRPARFRCEGGAPGGRARRAHGDQERPDLAAV